MEVITQLVKTWLILPMFKLKLTLLSRFENNTFNVFTLNKIISHVHMLILWSFKTDCQNYIQQ